MAIKIFTTGIEQYSAGGTGRVKVMVIGGPGVGKTRWSSYFPKPIYLDCEGGLASVADRRVQFASIKTSADMLDALTYLKQECSRPGADRQFLTVVVDTLDAYQRKVKDEWLAAHPAEQSFRGFEAWGYLETKMQQLTTKLLNLDMNVIVAVHYSEKTISEGVGDAKTERQELQLQLSGAFKDQAFNDFDLVGWMGTYFEVADGQRVQKRGLTFKPTPDKPFLKDRLHVTPSWMEVKFSDEDYADLFAAVAGRMDEMGETEEFGEIPTAQAEPAAVLAGTPALPQQGALPPMDPAEVPLVQHDKTTLQKMARDRGLDFRGNTLKGELVAMIEEHDAKAKAAPAPAPAGPTSEAASASPSATPAPAVEPQTPEAAGNLAQQTLRSYVAEAKGEISAAAGAASAPVQAASAPRRTEDEAAEDDRPMVLTEPAAPAPAPAPEVVPTPSGPVTVDKATGEVLTVSAPEAIENVAANLGGQVLSVTETVDVPEVAAGADCPEDKDDECHGICREDSNRIHSGFDGVGDFICTSPIGPNSNFITLSYIKHRKHLCNEHYIARKNQKAS